MNPRICICCGEPMPERDHGLSRNPNVCASCSSMADGIGELLLEALQPAADPPPTASPAPPSGARPEPKSGLNRTSARFLKHD